MVELILEKLNVTALVLVLAFFLYYIMEWIKLVLKDKLQDVYVQPISLAVGTGIASFVMYVYDFVPIDLGTAKFVWVSYLVQGCLLASLTGVIYDKFLDKGEEGTTSTSVELNVEKTETV